VQVWQKGVFTSGSRGKVCVGVAEVVRGSLCHMRPSSS